MKYLKKPNLSLNIGELLRKEIFKKITNLLAFLQNVGISQIEVISFCKIFTEPLPVPNFAIKNKP